MLCQRGASLSRGRGATVRKRAAALVLQWRAVTRLGPRKCRGALTDAARSERVAPAGGDAGQRAEAELPPGPRGMRDAQAVVARWAARPTQATQVRTTRGPAWSRSAANTPLAQTAQSHV